MITEHAERIEKGFAILIRWQVDPDLKEIILRHKLFEKCILVYNEIVPALNEFIKEKSFGKLLRFGASHLKLAYDLAYRISHFLHYKQCDQIGRFLKVLANKFSFKNRLNIW